MPARSTASPRAKSARARAPPLSQSGLARPIAATLCFMGLVAMVQCFQVAGMICLHPTRIAPPLVVPRVPHTTPRSHAFAPNTSLLNTTFSWHDVWEQPDVIPNGPASGEFTPLSPAMPNYLKSPVPERAPCPAPSQALLWMAFSDNNHSSRGPGGTTLPASSSTAFDGSTYSVHI